MATTEYVDVLVVGAGISGISAGYYLQTNCPDKSYAILEGRDALGGTWDLFRYPGIRSDSDMFTLGFSFRPWNEDESIADGPSILKYLKETAEAYGIDQKIRYRHRVKTARWSSKNNRWTVDVQVDGGDITQLTCNFLMMCSGYYNYEAGYTPEFPNLEAFQGQVVHPQKWSDDIEYEGKRVVVIGSGATAVTLVPSMADKAAHVTMLQRSPTYIISRPGKDRVARFLRKILPNRAAYHLARWKNILLTMYFYNISKRRPKGVKRFLLKQLRKELGDDYDIDKHFTPQYNPWDQRICLVPDSDLFQAIKQGDVSVVTDQIERFTETGIQLASGDHLGADMVVTATGLQLLFLGDVQLEVDGAVVEPSETMSYKGVMFKDIPNLSLSLGYINASWTLKCELICEYVCRLLNTMKAEGHERCTPRLNDNTVQEAPFMALNSGYIRRALDKLPKQGSKAPWKLHQNYIADMRDLRYGTLKDDALEFG